MKTHKFMCFYVGYFYAKILIFQKDYKGLHTKGYSIKTVKHGRSLVRLLFVNRTPRRIYLRTVILCRNGCSAVSGMEKTGDSSENPKQII